MFSQSAALDPMRSWQRVKHEPTPKKRKNGLDLVEEFDGVFELGLLPQGKGKRLFGVIGAWYDLWLALSNTGC